MGQNQGKISDKKHRKPKGLKHSKVPKKKNKKKIAKKMGKVSEEVYQEETGEWVEEDSGGFNETSKDTVDAKIEKHDKKAYTIEETQVDADLTTEKGNDDLINTYKYVKNSQTGSDISGKRNNTFRDSPVLETEKWLDRNEVDEKSVVLYHGRTPDTYTPSLKHEEHREDMNVEHLEEQFDVIQPPSSDRHFERPEYEAKNGQSMLKKKETYEITMDLSDKSVSNTSDVTEERVSTLMPDRSYRDLQLSNHQKPETVMQKSNNGRVWVGLGQESVNRRNPSNAMTDALVRPREVMEKVVQDVRHHEKKVDALSLATGQNDLIIKETVRNFGKRETEKQEGTIRNYRGRETESQEGTFRNFGVNTEMTSSSSSSGHRYQKAARQKQEKPLRQKYGTGSSKKKERISVLFFFVWLIYLSSSFD